MVLGIGALGNEVVKNLALYNIGNLFLCDMDTVEWANLSHSILFREKDDGHSKVSAAARSLKEINRLVKVQTFYGPLSDIGLGVWRSMDVIIGCLDNRGSRLMIDRTCGRAGKDWIDAGLGSLQATPNPNEGLFQGVVQLFSPRNGYSYEGYFMSDSLRQAAEQEASDARKAWRNWPGCYELNKEMLKTERVPTTPTMSSLIGALQAQEAIRYLCPEGWGVEGLENRCLEVNAARFSFDVKIHPRSEPTAPLDPIVEVPAWKAASTRLGEVMDRIKRDLGANARLQLGFHYCNGLECTVCNTVERRPFKLGSRSEVCPTCQRPRSPLTDSLLPEHLDGTEDFLDMTLSEIGVPAFDVLTASVYESAGRGQRPTLRAQRHYELTGDRAKALGL